MLKVRPIPPYNIKTQRGIMKNTNFLENSRIDGDFICF